MFWEGFQKRAYDYGHTHGPQHENPLPQSPDAPQKPAWKHPLMAAGGALAAGAGMYAALRKPWMNSRAVDSPGNALKIIESFARITAFSCL